ncbi:MAG: methyltransferase domain-containing protein [Planctomycetia bacterium]|nr:methyltransferase domain-containing protein [Planctomycetia bacterium]
MIGAVLFTWLQGAAFYSELHKQAVDTLPSGEGKTWIDLGCGPGLVSRLAAEKLYDVIGIDTDASMIQAARRLKKLHGSKANFEVNDLTYLSDKKADVISAASLLAVLDDKEDALNRMWESVLPKGHLLIIEPTELMKQENAKELIKTGLPKKRLRGLKMWATARENRTVDTAIFDTIKAKDKKTLELLGGLVKARIFKK